MHWPGSAPIRWFSPCGSGQPPSSNPDRALIHQHLTARLSGGFDRKPIRCVGLKPGAGYYTSLSTAKSGCEVSSCPLRKAVPAPGWKFASLVQLWPAHEITRGRGCRTRMLNGAALSCWARLTQVRRSRGGLAAQDAKHLCSWLSVESGFAVGSSPPNRPLHRLSGSPAADPVGLNSA